MLVNSSSEIVWSSILQTPTLMVEVCSRMKTQLSSLELVSSWFKFSLYEDCLSSVFRGDKSYKQLQLIAQSSGG